MKRAVRGLVAAVLAGALLLAAPAGARAATPEALLDPIAEIYELLEAYHKDGVDPERFLEGAIRGGLEALGDPYTQYYSPAEWEQHLSDLDGRFAGIELSFDAQIGDRLRIGGNFTHIDLDIEDALQPDLRVDGVPEHKALLFATWRPRERLTFTPSIEAADDRWSNVNPPVPEPYIATGEYLLVNFDLAYALDSGVELALGARNLRDENYEVAWGFPEPGRSVYAKLRVRY
ncbi:MAG: TonB-dependent receptor [Symbiobacteriaceae bacterium]